MRVFFSAIELSAEREHLDLLKSKLPQKSAILGAFDSAQKGRQKRPVLLGRANDFDWKAQSFDDKVIVRLGLTSKASMGFDWVVSFAASQTLPLEIVFRPIADRYSDKRAQAIIDANLLEGRHWSHGLNV